MTQDEIGAIIQQLGRVSTELEDVASLLKMHLEDPNLYQAWCLVPTGAVRRLIGVLHETRNQN